MPGSWHSLRGLASEKPEQRHLCIGSHELWKADLQGTLWHCGQVGWQMTTRLVYLYRRWIQVCQWPAVLVSQVPGGLGHHGHQWLLWPQGRTWGWLAGSLLPGQGGQTGLWRLPRDSHHWGWRLGPHLDWPPGEMGGIICHAEFITSFTSGKFEIPWWSAKFFIRSQIASGNSIP